MSNAKSVLVPSKRFSKLFLPNPLLEAMLCVCWRGSLTNAGETDLLVKEPYGMIIGPEEGAEAFSYVPPSDTYECLFTILTDVARPRGIFVIENPPH